MGFFPLPESEARKIHSLLSFPYPCSVIDPCAGPGTALNLITGGAQVEHHGIELDTRRAEQSTASGIHTIQGNVTTIVEDRQRDSTPGNRGDGSEEALAAVVITEE